VVMAVEENKKGVVVAKKNNKRRSKCRCKEVDVGSMCGRCCGGKQL